MRGSDYLADDVHSFRTKMAASAFVFVAFTGLLLAASYPVAAVTATVAALVTAVATVLVIDGRRRVGRTREVCVPGLGICVEA